MRTILSAFVAAYLALTGSPVDAQAASQEREINLRIDSETLAGALDQWAAQTGVHLISPSWEVAKKLTATPLKGPYTARQALEKLLSGTPLTGEWKSDRTVAIREKSQLPPAALQSSGADPKQAEAPITRFAGEDSGERRLASNDKDSNGSRRPVPERSAAAPDDLYKVEEVLVTGTHIRGAHSASPLVTIDREYIERGGFTTTHQVLQSVPQNFGGGDTEGTHASPGGSTGNVAYGSSVNLRGLGSGSTLVLINGQRLAPAAYGQFVDISLIPLSAVERIDVLTDGASATYGSDAVGGVVNVILRDQYDGAETLLKAGSVTSGNLDEYQFSQSVGLQGDRGSVVANYEFFSRSHLDVGERDFASQSARPFDLLPEQETQSLFVSGHVQATPRLRINGTALASQRDADALEFRGEVSDTSASTRLTSVLLGSDLELGNSWNASANALYSVATTRSTAVTASFRDDFDRRHELSSLELKLDGDVAALASGSIKLAVGASIRAEAFKDQEEPATIRLPSRNRDVFAGFAELFIPILGAANSVNGAQRLELTLAGRHENYSDFGTTTNPKIGVLWMPAAPIALRATYSTSFKAPTFFQLDESNVAALLFDLPDPSATDGATLTLWPTGNNSHLRPEEATSWTAGFDISMPALGRRSKLSATYFETRYKDRIVEPLPGLEVLGLFSQAEVYAPLITRGPTEAAVTDLLDRMTLINLYGPFVPSDVEALFNQQLQNLSEELVRGVDVTAGFDAELFDGEFSASLGSTYLLELADKITSTAASADLVGSAYHPVKMRARLSASWARDHFGVAGSVNYVDSFDNRTVVPEARVASWTTLDLQLSYDTGEAPGWLRRTRISLDVLNALDEDPPFMTSPVAQFDIGYDPTNASPLGRFLSLTVLKRW